ncbi:hypothetical protein COHA_000647 [Chlorella ohadii]|uniref:t-SNARE coiled-coil homology domain-containing protein n=1 Tax=Chlorella ohadii TaxID=2649997 RepID=A0AAD5E083_9CHLO|nr:hypothetical protein COHA_000647 [Chlorella ohadii]
MALRAKPGGYGGVVEVEARGGTASTSGAAAPLGTTRNRTELFLKYRRQARGSSRPLTPPGAGAGESSLETARLMASALGGGLDSAEAGVAGVMAAMPPQYVEFKEQIRLEMLNIKQRMGELRGLHGRATLSRFDDTNEDELQVEVLTQQITKMFRKCEARLQQFGGEPSASAADEKVKRNVQRTLAVELQRLSIQFRKQQKAYLNRLRSKDGGGAGGGSSFDLLGEGQQGRQQQEDFDPGFSDMQALKVDNLTSLIDERDREVQNIVSSINELAQIMKDLSVLVIDQGTILDRIDYNMEQVGLDQMRQECRRLQPAFCRSLWLVTSMKVEEGVRQLEKAEKKQKQSRMVLCIMLLLCAVVVMLLLVVFKAIFL